MTATHIFEVGAHGLVGRRLGCTHQEGSAEGHIEVNVVPSVQVAVVGVKSCIDATLAGTGAHPLVALGEDMLLQECHHTVQVGSGLLCIEVREIEVVGILGQ